MVSEKKVRNWYFALIVIGGFSIVYSYNEILFRALPGKTILYSHLVEISLIAMGVIIELTLCKNLNKTHILLNVILALELYAAVAYWKSHSIYFEIPIGLAIIASLMGIVVWIRKSNRSGRRKAHKIYCYMRRNFVIAGAVPIIILYIQILFSGGIYMDARMPLYREYTEVLRLDEKIEEFSDLQEEVFGKMGSNAKVNLLREILSYESACHGDPVEMNLFIREFEDDSVLGSYVRKYRAVSISADLLENGTAAELLEVLLHEVHHAYVYSLLEGIQIKEGYESLNHVRVLNQLEYELETYTISSQNPETYYNLLIESLARDYAKDRTEEYFMLLGE